MISPRILNGDLVLENNDFVMIDGDDELAQSVESVLQTRQEEFFLDLEHGLIRDNILGKQADQEDARDDIINAVSQEERIDSIDEIVFDDNRSKRTREVSLTLQKNDGETLSMEGVEIGAG